jgi:hypothetical protein
MVVAVAAMVYGAALEAHRLAVYREWAVGGGGGDASVPVSILWQAPAYVLVAASEVLASIAQLELFYQQVRGGAMADVAHGLTPACGVCVGRAWGEHHPEWWGPSLSDCATNPKTIPLHSKAGHAALMHALPVGC